MYVYILLSDDAYILITKNRLFIVENEDHCDFVKLREALLRVNVEDLRERTHKV